MDSKTLDREIAEKGHKQLLREGYIERIKQVAPELPEEHYESALKLIDHAYYQGMCGGFAQALQDTIGMPEAVADALAAIKWSGTSLFE